MKTYTPLIAMVALSLVFACTKQQLELDSATPPPPETTEAVTESSLLAEARAALDRNDDTSAYQLYEQYLTQFPQGAYTGEVLMQKGVIAENRGELGRALADYRRLTNDHPLSPWAFDAHQKIVEILLTQRQYERMIQHVDDALITIKDKVRQANIYRVLGDGYMQQAAYRSALRFYVEAYNRFFGEPREAVATKLESAAGHLPADELKMAVEELAPGEAKGHLTFFLGNRYMIEENYTAALEIFKLFIETYPEHPQATMARDAIDDLAEMAINRDTIGCLFPLSGPYADFGALALEGVELALHQFTAGSLNPAVRIIVKDTGGNATQALRAYQELVNAEVTAIIGPMITADSVATQAQEDGIPLMALTQKENIPQLGDFIFRNFLTPKIQVDALVNYAVNELGINRFAVLYPSEKYGITFMHQFWDRVEAHGAELKRIESYGADQTDFAAAIKKLIKEYKSTDGEDPVPIIDFEAIFIPDGPDTAGLLIPQIVYHDIDNVHFLGTNLWYSPKLIDMARQFVQGSILPVGFYPSASSWRVTGFVDEFTAVFGRTPGFLEAVAYDSAMILFDIITRAQASYRSLVRDELLQLTNYPGVTGITTFTPDGDVKKELYLLSILGDQFVELE